MFTHASENQYLCKNIKLAAGDQWAQIAARGFDTRSPALFPEDSYSIKQLYPNSIVVVCTSIGTQLHIVQEL